MSAVSQVPDQESGSVRAWLEDMRAKWLADIPAKAEKGDAQSQYALGSAFAFGDLLAKDDTEAVKWYRKAADQNFATAQYTLANCYLEGRGV